MRSLRPLTAFAALAGLLSAEAARAQTQAAPCLSEQEVGSLITYALPVVMDSAIKACTPKLAPQGYFATQGPSLVQRYAARKPGAWPMAKAALLKLGSEKGDKMGDMITKLPDEALQPFAEGLVSQMVTEGIKPDQCVAIERATRLLSPLPPENTAELITFVITLADKPKPGVKSKFPLCAVKG